MMLRDFQGQLVRLTDERLRHILERHPEMVGMEWAIAETVESPDAVVASRTDPDRVNEYYKWFTNTDRGDKFIRVVVRSNLDDAFVLTAHMARRIPRRGE